MKQLIFSLLFVASFAFNACSQPGSGKKLEESLVTNRQMTKDYFFCMCLYEGFGKDTVFYRDHTMAVLGELITFDPKDIAKIDSMARAVASKMEKSEYTGAKPIMWDCLSIYNGKELDRLIKSFKEPENKKGK